MSYAIDAVVIGAGVVGLACARRLALAGLETVVLEKESRFGQGISSRNSEVIHAGLYYAPASLKARLCREGREQLYTYCQTRHIGHRRTGKWVVATQQSQLGKLEALRDNAFRNSVVDVQMIDGKDATAMEPELVCSAALVSPSTGIVDSHGLMTALLADFENAGGNIACRAPVLGGRVISGGVEVTLGDAEKTKIQARRLINSAGLSAPVLAASLDGFPAAHVPQRSFAKGNYFSLSGKSPFSRLIYPLPEPGGLGVHLTLDLQGQARFGPDIQWITAPEYSVDTGRIDAFVQAIRQYWPACTPERLSPAYSGIRPKLGSPEAPGHDFVIQDETTHGVPGLINFFGIESPGLTSCLALADEMVMRLGIH